MVSLLRNPEEGSYYNVSKQRGLGEVGRRMGLALEPNDIIKTRYELAGSYQLTSSNMEADYGYRLVEGYLNVVIR